MDESVLVKHLASVYLAQTFPAPHHPLAYDRRELPLSRAQLNAMAKRAAQLKIDLGKLNRTSLVFFLFSTGNIPEGDLLGPPFFDDRKFAALDTVAMLPSVAASYNKALYPRVDHHLAALFEYVRKTTGGPQYDLLVQILGPVRVAHTDSTDSLKMWRTRFLKKRNA